MSQLKEVRQGQIAFEWPVGLQLIGWSLPALGRAICFTQSTAADVNLLPKHPHRHFRSNVWPSIRAPCGHQVDLKWTITFALWDIAPIISPPSCSYPFLASAGFSFWMSVSLKVVLGNFPFSLFPLRDFTLSYDPNDHLYIFLYRQPRSHLWTLSSLSRSLKSLWVTDTTCPLSQSSSHLMDWYGQQFHKITLWGISFCHKCQPQCSLEYTSHRDFSTTVCERSWINNSPVPALTLSQLVNVYLDNQFSGCWNGCGSDIMWHT